MPTGVVYGKIETKKKEKIEQTLNNEIINLIDDIVNEINIYSLSKRIRESLIVLFNRYSYLKKNIYKINNIRKSNTCIYISLLDEKNIETEIRIEFTLNNFNVEEDEIDIHNKRLDLRKEKAKIMNDKITIIIEESKIVPNSHRNMYSIYLSIRDLVNNNGN